MDLVKKKGGIVTATFRECSPKMKVQNFENKLHTHEKSDHTSCQLPAVPNN